MQREDRYIVIKKSDIESAIQSEDLTKQEAWNLKTIARLVDHGRESRGKQRLECVVVESDWPEYEPVWNMIAARVDGSPGQQAKPVKFALSTLDGRIQTSKESVFNSQKEAEKALADLSAALSTKISLQIVPLYTIPPANVIGRPATPDDSPYPATIAGGCWLAQAWADGYNVRNAVTAAPESLDEQESKPVEPDISALADSIVRELVDCDAVGDGVIARSRVFVYNACRSALLGGKPDGK
jgi:hypothetical protein